jgi:sialidase-1
MALLREFFRSMSRKIRCLEFRNAHRYFPNQKGLSHFRQVAWSNDGGESFSPVVHDAGLPEPICEGSVCRYTLEKNDPQGRGKNRVLFSNPGNEKEGERHHLTVRLSYDECRTWPVSKVIYEGPSSYSDICIAQDGTICCLYEKGQRKGVSTYSGDITLARFDLEWLTDGEDAL